MFCIDTGLTTVLIQADNSTKVKVEIQHQSVSCMLELVSGTIKK